jgi:hypothetical protein
MSGAEEWAGWKQDTKIRDEGNKIRLNYSKEGKNNSSVNSSKIDRRGGRKIFFFSD